MIAENLNITIVQTDIIWEDESANLAALDSQLNHLPSQVDVVVLPEMFTTGFSMNATKIATQWDDENLALKWMKKKAAQYKAAFTGSIAVREGDHFFNRLIWVEPDGQYSFYDKRHTFSFAGEDQVYSHGNKKLIVTWKGWKICLLICYDLRFPVWSRNTIHEGHCDYDLLIYVANWPAVRSLPWRQLLVARSIENLSYVAGCNRIGIDGNAHAYSGDSAVLNFLGEVLTPPNDNSASLLSATCCYADLMAFRNKFPALKDGDSFRIL